MAGPTQATKLPGDTPMARTVASITPAANPRQPA